MDLRFSFDAHLGEGSRITASPGFDHGELDIHRIREQPAHMARPFAAPHRLVHGLAMGICFPGITRCRFVLGRDGEIPLATDQLARAIMEEQMDMPVAVMVGRRGRMQGEIVAQFSLIELTASVLRIIGILLASIARMRSPRLWLLVEWLSWAVRRIVKFIGTMADQVALSDPSAWRVRRIRTAPPQRWAAP